MTIRLTPEDEKLIQQRVQRGAFANAEEVIHDALAAQAAEIETLVENKEMINAKIAHAIEQLDSGEGISGEIAREHLQARKAKWLNEKPPKRPE